MPKTITAPQPKISSCDNCSKCCEYINIVIPKPKTKREIDRVVWFLLHGVSIHIDREGDWMVYIPNKCKKLGKDGRCTAYSTRPTICRKYSHTECEKYDRKCCNQHEFNDEKEFLGFVRSDPTLKNIYSKKTR